MSASIHRLRRHSMPTATIECLRKLLKAAEDGRVTGIAFVALMDGSGFIADTCGEANREPEEVRLMLQQLDAKIVRRHLKRS